MEPQEVSSVIKWNGTVYVKTSRCAAPCDLRTSTGSSETSATVSHVAAEFTASVFVAGNVGLETKGSQGFLWLRIDTRGSVHGSEQQGSSA